MAPLRMIHGRTLADVRWVPSTNHEFRLMFAELDGITEVRGRQLGATVDGDELAQAIGAIPNALLDEQDAAAVTRVMRLLRSPVGRPSASVPGDEMRGGQFVNVHGVFYSPDAAAAYVICMQGGFTTPLREAGRMIRAGGEAERLARRWLTGKGYTEKDLDAGNPRWRDEQDRQAVP